MSKFPERRAIHHLQNTSNDPGDRVRLVQQNPSSQVGRQKQGLREKAENRKVEPAPKVPGSLGDALDTEKGEEGGEADSAELHPVLGLVPPPVPDNGGE